MQAKGHHEVYVLYSVVPGVRGVLCGQIHVMSRAAVLMSGILAHEIECRQPESVPVVHYSDMKC